MEKKIKVERKIELLDIVYSYFYELNDVLPRGGNIYFFNYIYVSE